MKVSVVTAAIPSRLALLRDAMDSVLAQTVQPDEHLVAVDYARRGTARVVTQLALAARNAWIATLEDDDRWHANHLEVLTEAAGEGDCDIVYSWCEVEGRDWSPNSEFDADRLRRENFIPATVLIRRELVADLGGWRDGTVNGWEDWDMWLRALAVGARFRCVPVVTWAYRFHGGNKTLTGERMAY